MRSLSVLSVILLLGASEVRPGQGSSSALSVWDTGSPSKFPLSAEEAAARKGWTRVSRNDAAHAFKGDAVVENGRLLCVVRKNSAGAECYALTSGKIAHRATLTILGENGRPAGRPGKVSRSSHNRSAVQIASGAARFRLKRGDISVEIQPGAGAARIRIESPSRYVVLPDFFSNDIVVGAADVPAKTAEIPSENFLLHPRDGGNAIVMAVFEHRDQDVRLLLDGEGDGRRIAASEIEFGKGKKVWVALLEGRGIWHEASVGAGDAGKIVPLRWTMPFPAQWRVDFTRTDELIHSWEMLLQEKEGGSYLKPTFTSARLETLPPTRKRWMGSHLYTIPYPAWSDPAGKGFVQPVKKGWLKYAGPVLVYPANRVPKTPIDVFTVVDVVRNTLGQGPCEYILALESQSARLKGRATCSVRDELKMMYEKGQQKARRKDALRFLDQGIEFVKHIRGRIDGYLKLVAEFRTYLAEQKKARPSVAKEIVVLEKILKEADGHVEEREKHLRPVSHVVKLTDDFRRTMVGYDGPDALPRLKKYTDELTEIGDAQDSLVARLRWVIKTVRERSALLMTRNPELTPIAREIRERSRNALKNPSMHEERR